MLDHLTALSIRPDHEGKPEPRGRNRAQLRLSATMATSSGGLSRPNTP